MADYDPKKLELWREHLEDFVLIQNPGRSADEFWPDWVSPYLIYNVHKRYGYPLEDAYKHRALVDEMMAAGVRTVTWREGFKILYPRMFAQLSEANNFEKFWQANYPYDVD